MSLRLKINAIVGALTLAFVITALTLQFANMRESVHEEVIAAHRVAAQLLTRAADVHRTRGTDGMLEFLRELGRLRSNEVTLVGVDGRVLYRSPPSRYKAGRDAPRWFVRLIAPWQETRTIAVGGETLQLEARPSRAVLDAWDRFLQLAIGSVVLLLAVNALVFWLVGRAAQPFARIVDGLNEVEAGRLGTVLPPLRGREAAAIGAAFNRMVGALAQNVETERQAARAERELSDSRELTRWIARRIERERLLIARELHDEFGQSVTAIRSMALSIVKRADPGESASRQSAQLIADESSRLYDAMHGLIPRLAPLVLDSFGLRAALGELVDRTRSSHQGLCVDLQVALPDQTELSADATLALYRAAQEGLTNALRHGQALKVRIELRAEGDVIALDIVDDGQGLADDWSGRPGHHGLRWLSARVESLGGRVALDPAHPRGAWLLVRIPLRGAAEPAADDDVIGPADMAIAGGAAR